MFYHYFYQQSSLKSFIIKYKWFSQQFAKCWEKFEYRTSGANFLRSIYLLNKKERYHFGDVTFLNSS